MGFNAVNIEADIGGAVVSLKIPILGSAPTQKLQPTRRHSRVGEVSAF
jgi:hypothetical protein